MELSINSWHDKFYASTFNSKTSNFCDHFWGLVLALITLPFTWSIYLLNLLFKGKNGYGAKLGAGLMINFLLLGLGISIHETYWIDWFVGFGIGISIVIGILLAIFSIITYNESSFKNKVKETASLPVEAFKSFKGKYCPKITWVKKV
jgi:hypothetical protein